MVTYSPEGTVVLVSAVVVSAWLVGSVWRFARKTDSLMEAMAQAAFIPEKRRRYLSILSIEGSLVLLTAISWGLGQVGVIPGSLGGDIVAAFLLSGMLTVAALTWVGLRPAHLSAIELAEFRARAPQLLYSLAFAPMGGTGRVEDREPRGMGGI
ncbi:MAG: hypothetical protein L3K17_04655 [Thermoplasmata archaeon]|nr:hypothetical protein [Thermoplasmata archaeon]